MLNNNNFISIGHASLLKRAHILRLLCTNEDMSRVALAQKAGLTKTTLSNIISELIQADIVCERPDGGIQPAGAGRRPVYLDLSATSPLAVGILLNRKGCRLLFTDLKLKVVAKDRFKVPEDISSDELCDLISEHFRMLKEKCGRPLIAVGIATPGPIDSVRGVILNPDHFYGLRDVEICKMLSDRLGYECHLISDSSAGALCENLYGIGKKVNHFIFVNISRGIGAGIVVDGQIHRGSDGIAGELGHTSINFSGPPCICGNRGCLEQYANEENVIARIRELCLYSGDASFPPDKEITWWQIQEAAANGNGPALAALDEFCEYLSFALGNAINTFDLSAVIVGGDQEGYNDVIKTMLQNKLSGRVAASYFRDVRVYNAYYGSDAISVGSVSNVISKVFNGEINILRQ